MNWERLKKGVAGAVLVLTVLLGSGMLAENSVQAQRRDRDGRWDRDRDHDRGRHRGWYRGNRRNGRDWRRDRDWDRDRYRYRNNRPYYGSNRSYGYRGGYGLNVARQQGYRDGQEKAIEDLRKRRSYDLVRHERYRDADRGYRSEYGSKDAYRAAYRDGFRSGYDQAYRQYAYRRW